MENRIAKALDRLFQKHRIVFWYDPDGGLVKEYESLALDGVEKVAIANNEFGLKYRLLREQPNSKFLVYKPESQPDDIGNWLLDVQLSHVEFRTDQNALWLADLELGYEFTVLTTDHAEFFNNKRLEALKKIVSASDTLSLVRLKMLAVCVGSDARLDSVLEHLLEELAIGKSECINAIRKTKLYDFLWEQVSKTYGYVSNTPGSQDFVIELFKSCYAMTVDGSVRLNSEALVFLKRWKDSRQHETSFEKLSDECASVLSIENDLNNRDYASLLAVDYFEMIDRKIVSDLIANVRGRKITAGQCTQQIRERRTSHWFGRFQDLYDAIDFGSQFLALLDALDVRVESAEQAVKAYTSTLFRADQLYRKFILHMRRSGQVTLLEELATEIGNRYTNAFLRPLSDHWQACVDQMQNWVVSGVRSQRHFYGDQVSTFLDKGKKIYVIVSDALRYEIADELAGLIRREDRYDADLKACLSMLPCYTQLGMASLLPNKTLAINNDASATVLVDGNRSPGIDYRDEILKRSVPGGAALAIHASEFLSKNRDQCRELTKDHEVIYLYQNRIDETGHSVKSEKDVFSAVEEAMEEIVKLVKKLAAANASNILITSDHGFLYQDEPLDEGDFSIAEPTGEILFTDRRFILGKNLAEVAGVKKFTAAQVGLEGDWEVVLPKSINRFRKKGSTMQFVHGGCTLQEVIIPIIEVKKRRSSDTTQVEVNLIPSSSAVISSGQLAIALYQAEAATDKVQPRTLRIGIYAPNGELISDSFELKFDMGSDNPREREQKIRLLLSKRADDFNNQQVILRLEEPVAGTTHFREYKTAAYSLRRSFTSDFE